VTTEGLPPDPPLEPSSLDDPSTGARVIRGSAYRTVGYGLMVLLALISTPLLTRHLGVVDFGRYVAVSTLMMILTLVADAGLTAVGIREYPNLSAEQRRELMRNLLGVRLVVAFSAVTVTVAILAAAGSEDVIVAGSALAGAGVVLAMIQHTFTIPLHAELRLAFATVLEVLRAALVLVGIVVLIAAGAGLVPFLGVTVPVGVVVLLVTVIALRRSVELRPRLGQARYLLRESIPAAAASTLSTLFYRVGVLMVSLLATATATGYFATSFRVVEAFVAVPPILVNAAYPALARFAATDRPRLVAAMQQLFDMSVILGVISAIAVAFMAQPAIDVIAGEEFQPAVDVLRIQSVALGGTFLVTLFSGGLWILREKRALVVGNVIGVIAAVVLTAILVPLADEQGAAAGMVAAEALLGVYLGRALLRAHPDLRPSLARLPRVALAAAAALAVWLVPIPDVPRAALAMAVLLGLMYALGVLPRELWRSFARRGAGGTLAP
jgi:O-antigen/teichoic acid export membrane protein